MFHNEEWKYEYGQNILIKMGVPFNVMFLKSIATVKQWIRYLNITNILFFYDRSVILLKKIKVLLEMSTF